MATFLFSQYSYINVYKCRAHGSSLAVCYSFRFSFFPIFQNPSQEKKWKPTNHFKLSGRYNAPSCMTIPVERPPSISMCLKLVVLFSSMQSDFKKHYSTIFVRLCCGLCLHHPPGTNTNMCPHVGTAPEPHLIRPLSCVMCLRGNWIKTKKRRSWVLNLFSINKAMHVLNSVQHRSNVRNKSSACRLCLGFLLNMNINATWLSLARMKMWIQTSTVRMDLICTFLTKECKYHPCQHVAGGIRL